MPATGKKFADESEVLARIARLEKQVAALRNGTLDIELGGATEELWVVVNVVGPVSKKLVIEDGVITAIE